MSKSDTTTHASNDEPAKSIWQIISSFLLYFVAPTALILVVYLVWDWLGVKHFESYPSRVVGGTDNKAADAGAFGDSFGYVNALFSGLAFSGVIYAIILQTIELRLQRQEIELNRRELTKTADANINLVKLNTLTTLSRYYFDHIAHNSAHTTNEYNDAIMVGIDKMKQTTVFKMNNCVLLLESLYGELAGKPMGEPVIPDLELQRKKRWHHDFLWGWDTLNSYWNGPGRGVLTPNVKGSEAKKDLTVRWTNYVEHIERTLLRYPDCLNEDEQLYREPLERAGTEAREFAVSLGGETEFVAEDWQAGHEILSRLNVLVGRSREFLSR
jgi:hypothetical protein